MNDTYVELLVKKPRVKAASVLHIFMIVLGAVLFFIGIMTTFLITLCGLLCYGGAYLLTLNTCIEYEYLYLDKELTVDKIKNQARRKTVASYSIETMEVMAPKGSHRLDSYQNLAVKDYSSQTQEGQAFELVVEGTNGRERIIIDTNEELIKAMKMAAPRKIFTD